MNVCASTFGHQNLLFINITHSGINKIFMSESKIMSYEQNQNGQEETPYMQKKAKKSVLQELKKIHEALIDLIVSVQDLAESFQRVCPRLNSYIKENHVEGLEPNVERGERRGRPRIRLEDKSGLSFYKEEKKMKKSQVTEDKQVEAVVQLLNGQKSTAQLGTEFGCTDRTIRRWKQKYQDNGYENNGHVKPHLGLNFDI